MQVLSKLKKEPGLWLSEASIPEPAYDEVRIRIKKTAICGTDVHIYEWDEWAQKTIPVPMHVGHEFMGVIDKVGEGVRGFKVGDRVSGEGHITCGYCRNCRAGQRHLCRNTEGIGVNRPGAFAAYLVIPAVNTCKIPSSISDSVAAMMDPLGNAVHTALEFDLVGEDVLITGAGPIGVMAAAISKFVGARYVVVTDVNEFRLELARKMGATKAINPTKTTLNEVMKQLGMTEGFDVNLEMSGNEGAVQDMLAHMNNGGKIAFLGIPPKPFAIDWHKVIFKGLTIKGIYGRKMFETWYKMINLLESGLNVEPVITHHFPANEFEKAFAAVKSGKAGKVILEWE
ncbi:MAG TPA: L-threonine 3-dehydrogenase [Coxiellaceae bacterium]|nr:L-threonine 3-dehydrogenase [Coxiellaceae bacterium]